jgi:acetyl esterase
MSTPTNPGSRVMSAFFNGIAGLGRRHPEARRRLQALDVVRDVPYGPLPEHRLDIYRPRDPNPRPAVLYLHGGAFQILSKDTHWLMGLTFARMGGTVFVPNYRLAPRHPFPAAIEDACRAACWVQANAHRFGADVDRLVLAGESAGANLACSVAVAASWRRPEPYAAEVFEAGLRPQLLFPACGILQVTDSERLLNPKLAPFTRTRLMEVSRGYLSGQVPPPHSLADPLCILEAGDAPERPWPPTFAACGTRDPLLEDTRRLGRALQQRGVPHEVRIYPGEVHAFHAFIFRPAARQCWRDHGAFWQRHMPQPLETPDLSSDAS